MFKSKAELGGEVDKNIWRGGNVNPEKKGTTRRAQVQSELSSLIRKLRPHQAEAVKQAVRILSSEGTADTTVLKASVFMTHLYRDLLKDLSSLPDEENEKETVEDLIEKPRFQLHMLKPEDKK